ncbi:MAG: hypothetical protein ACI8QQ_003178 [Psychroserpens sp.]|jgi:hypothetical protein
MKNNFLRLSLVLLIIFGLSSCKQGSKEQSTDAYDNLKKELAVAKEELKTIKEDESASANNVAPCADGTPTSQTHDEDLLIKYDCSNTLKFQHMHIDLKHQFGVLSKMTFGANKKEPTAIDFRLKEVGTCQRYNLKSVTYTGSKIDKGRMVHNFKVTIDNYTGSGTLNREISLKSANLVHNNKQLKINLKDLFDIHIDNPIINPKNGIAPELNLQIMTKYQHQICLTEASGI